LKASAIGGGTSVSKACPTSAPIAQVATPENAAKLTSPKEGGAAILEDYQKDWLRKSTYNKLDKTYVAMFGTRRLLVKPRAGLLECG
jgi:hypothetical protein